MVSACAPGRMWGVEMVGWGTQALAHIGSSMGNCSILARSLPAQPNLAFCDSPTFLPESPHNPWEICTCHPAPFPAGGAGTSGTSGAQT